MSVRNPGSRPQPAGKPAPADQPRTPRERDPRSDEPISVEGIYGAGGNWMRPDDIGSIGSRLTVKIMGVDLNFDFESDRPGGDITLAFEGQDKWLRLNKTNASTLAALYGDDARQWIGQSIMLLVMQVQNPDKQYVAGIRVAKP